MIKKIAVFTGTRAEYGLLYWLLKDIQCEPDFELQLVVSGMHLSPEFGETYKEIEKDGFLISEKVEILLSSNSSAGTAKSIGLGVIGFADALSRLKPDVLVVLGDRFEALAIAQTAMIMRVPILHIHGGEITEGAYDDAIRHAITKLSYVHATSTEDHRKRVIQLGEAPGRVHNVGALGLDHLKRAEFMSIEQLSESLNFNLGNKYFVVTYHPVTLAQEKAVDTYANLLTALEKFTDYQVILTYPNADDGGRSIIPLLEEYAAKNPERVLAIPSLGHTRYLSAVKYASAVIGNSSSGIIEVPSFNIPTVNIGMRQQGRMAANSVVNCDNTLAAIVSAIDMAISGNFKGQNLKIVNPYGAGDASKKIIALLKEIEGGEIKTFYDLKVST